MTKQMSLGSPNVNTKVGQNKSAFGSFGGGYGFGTKAAPAPPPDPLLARLYKTRDSYNPGVTAFRFQSIFYNKKEPSFSAQKGPPSVTPEDWNSALASVPDPSMCPTAICGFKDLYERMEHQKGIVEKMQNKLIDMRAHITQLQEINDNGFSERYTKIIENNHLIQKLLMEVLKIDEVRALHNYQFCHDEHELLDRLEQLNHDINRPNRYIAALNTLKLRAKLMKDSRVAHAPVILSPNEKENLEELLKIHTDALHALVKQTKAMERTSKVLDETVDREIGLYVPEDDLVEEEERAESITPTNPL